MATEDSTQEIAGLIVEPITFALCFLPLLFLLCHEPKSKIQLPTDTLKKIFIEIAFYQSLHTFPRNLESSVEAVPDLLQTQWCFSPSGLCTKGYAYIVVRALFVLAIPSVTVGVGKWVYVLENFYKALG